MAIATSSTEFQISPIAAEKITPQTLATEHNRRPFGSIHRNPDVKDQAQKVQLGDHLIRKIRGFEKAISMLKKVEVTGAIVAGAVGLLGMITGSGELSQAALMAGGAAIGAGSARGPREAVARGFAGAIVGGGIAVGLQQVPGIDSHIAGVAPILNDLPTAAIAAGVVIKEKRKLAKVRV